MAKVSLRAYNREIGTLIDQGQVEEAVGHCHHILKTYPKHLETYQLLGKAYLEAKRYKDASDIFSRLLTSVPDDFVANVGMSLIADETEQLDDAIWHMERAFEGQPSNAAVQNELQRLYGRRDGVQPPKIRMTSGALANVYVQGELYPQAIAEIMSVEAQDPGRMDMQVLRAKAYFRSGQRVEASKAAADLLAKYPYCLEANRILVEILPETSRAESTQIYRQRINALDPYAAFVEDSIFDTSAVPDAAVSLERLDWQPGDTKLESDWDAAASGIQLDGSDNKEPDWLKEGGTNAEFSSATATETSAAPADEIPDFMRAAGWGTSSGAEEPTSFFDDNDEEPIAKAELPEWMKSIAPDQATLEAENEFTDDTTGDAMADDWLNDLLGGSEEKPQEENSNARAESAPEWTQKAQEITPEVELPAADDDMAWLNELGDEETSEPAIEGADEIPEWLRAAQAPAEPAAEDDDMAWLNTLGAEEEPAPAVESDNVPEWLREAQATPAQVEEKAPVAEKDDDMAWLNALGGKEEPVQAEEEDDDMAWLNALGGEEEPVQAEEEIPVEEDDMAWMSELDAEEAPAPAEAAGIQDPTIGSLGTSSADQDAAMNWLESLAANQGAKAEELITDPNARTETAPEWVQKAQNVSQSATPEVTPPAAEEIPVEEDDDMAWLNALGGEEEPVQAEEEMPVEEDDMAWMSELDAEEAPAPAEAAGIQDPTIGSLGTSSADQDAAMNWLESLAANQGAKAEELITDPNARTETAPEWVQKAQDVSQSATPEVTPPAAEEFPVEEDDDMAWLNALGGEEEPVQVEEEMPVEEDDMAWMSELDAEESPAPAEAAGIQDPTIGSLGTSSADQDAAMNWLESLAANQGAKAEELITDPNARTETAPEWVQKAQDISQSATPEVTPPAAKIPVEEDDDMAWLNALGGEEEPVQAEEEPAPAEATGIQDPTIGSLGTSSADQDAAMNWLESLAANQGAKAEELITDPNARTETAPEWVQKAQDVSQSATPEVTPPAAKIPVEKDDDMAWLNALGAEEEPVQAEEEMPVEEDDMAWMNELDAEEELAPAIESDSVPEWLRETQATSAQAEEEAPVAEEDDLAWMNELEGEESASVTESAEELLDESTVEDEEEKWLAEQAERRLAYTAPDPTPNVPVAQVPAEETVAPASSPAPVDETPDWLKTMVQEEIRPVASAPAQAKDDLPDWLSDMDKPVEESKAATSDDLPDWLKEDEAPVQPVVPKPTRAEDWKPIAPAAQEKPAPPPEKMPEIDLPPHRRVQRMNTTMLRDITLMSAQAAMREGNVSAALAEYGKMIKKKRLLDETIYDLREALYDYPVDVSIWQMLGDAYMRAGRLQEAINAYTKAEELLR